MEPTKQLNEGAYEYVKRIVTPIFKAALQETKKNRRLVGTPLVPVDSHTLYNPHNYRLYFDFSKENFKPQNRPPNPGWSYPKVVNSTEYNSKKGKYNIRVKRNQIEIAFPVKDWHRIKLIEPVTPQFIIIIQGYDKICKEIVKDFIKNFGGKSYFHILKRRSEDKIQGENIINKLPQESIFYNRVGKKVYHKKVFEFKNPVLASNYLETAALLRLAPEIVNAISTINPLRTLKATVKTPEDIILNKELIACLSQRELNDFSTWSFKNVHTKEKIQSK